MDRAYKNLWYWIRGGTSFSCRLYDLMTKADMENFGKLETVYPQEAKAFMEWRLAEDEDAFLESKGYPVGESRI